MLDEFRDIMIIITAFSWLFLILLFMTLLIIVFRRVSRTLDSVSAIMSDIRDVSSLMSKTVKPTIKVLSFAAGTRKALSALTKRGRKEEKVGKVNKSR